MFAYALGFIHRHENAVLALVFLRTSQDCCALRKCDSAAVVIQLELTKAAVKVKEELRRGGESE